MSFVIGRARPEIGAKPVGYDAQHPAQCARSRDAMDVFVGGNRPHQQPDQQQLSRFPRGFDHRFGVVQRERKRGLAEDVFTSRERGDYELAMIHRGKAYIDGVNRWVIDQYERIRHRLRAAELRNGLRAVGVTAEDANDLRCLDSARGNGMLSAHRARAENSDSDLSFRHDCSA